MDNTALLKRFESLSGRRRVVEQAWQEIEKFVTPYRGEFFSSNTGEGGIEWGRDRHDYDSTAVMAHQNLAASLHGALTNPSVRWFDMKFRQEKLNRNKAAAMWLEECGDHVYYALQDSNFNLEINETYQDLAGPGTAVLSLEEAPSNNGKFGGLNFTAVPLKEAYFELDWRKRVIRFFRKLEWDAPQILSKFGREVPKCILDADEKGTGEKFDILFIVYPRGDRIVPLGEQRSPSKRPFAYRYILMSEAETLGKEGGYYEMPTFAVRWRTTSESVWGNSPAMLAMGDIRTLNEKIRMRLAGIEKLIDPPMAANESAMLADLDISAGAINIMKDTSSLKAIDTGYNSSEDLQEIARLQENIRNYFFANQLTFPDPQGTPMSATEAQIRHEEMQRLIGPTMGRIQHDLLDPIISRTFRMLARAQKLPEPPSVVVESNAEFDINYLGPLARAQRTDGAVAVERFMGFVANIAAVAPGALDVVDVDATIRGIARALSVPADALRDQAEVEKARKEAAEQEQEMIDLQKAEQEGKAMQAQASAAQELPPQ